MASRICVQVNFEEKKNDDGVEYGDEKTCENGAHTHIFKGKEESPKTGINWTDFLLSNDNQYIF